MSRAGRLGGQTARWWRTDLCQTIIIQYSQHGHVVNYSPSGGQHRDVIGPLARRYWIDRLNYPAFGRHTSGYRRNDWMNEWKLIRQCRIRAERTYSMSCYRSREIDRDHCYIELHNWLERVKYALDIARPSENTFNEWWLQGLEYNFRYTHWCTLLCVLK